MYDQELRGLQDFETVSTSTESANATQGHCLVLAIDVILMSVFVLRRQAAAQLTDSPAAPAEPAAAAAPPAADGTAATANGTTAAAAEVADAARRLRMDPRLAARAQAELRISKPQVWVRLLKPLLGGLTTG